MALKLSTYSFRSLSLSGVYARVEQAAGGKRAGVWRGLAKVYASAAAANPSPIKVGERPRLDEKNQPVLVDGEPVMDPVLQAPEPQFLEELAVSAAWVSGGVPEQLLYAELKKREGFAGAIDV
jgi:hypothetical protein